MLKGPRVLIELGQSSIYRVFVISRVDCTVEPPLIRTQSYSNSSDIRTFPLGPLNVPYGWILITYLHLIQGLLMPCFAFLFLEYVNNRNVYCHVIRILVFAGYSFGMMSITNILFITGGLCLAVKRPFLYEKASKSKCLYLVLIITLLSWMVISSLSKYMSIKVWHTYKNICGLYIVLVYVLMCLCLKLVCMEINKMQRRVSFGQVDGVLSMVKKTIKLASSVCVWTMLLRVPSCDNLQNSCGRCTYLCSIPGAFGRIYSYNKFSLRSNDLLFPVKRSAKWIEKCDLLFNKQYLQQFSTTAAHARYIPTKCASRTEIISNKFLTKYSLLNTCFMPHYSKHPSLKRENSQCINTNFFIVF